MQVTKPPKSLIYNPSMNNAVTHFRHQVLLDRIEEVNKESNRPASFHLTKDGLELGDDPYGFFPDKMAPWHIEHSLNFLEANGKIHLFLPIGPHSGDIAAVISELVPTILPPGTQRLPATNPQTRRSTDTKQ